MANKNFKEVKKIVDQLPVISSHEHHLTDEIQLTMNLDKILDFAYVGWFAGRKDKKLAETPMDDPLLPDRIQKKKYSLPDDNPAAGKKQLRKERKEFLDRFGVNSYWVWLEKGIQKIYHLDKDINPKNWDNISEIIAERHADPGAHLEIMKKDGGYLRAVQDTYWDYSSDLGHPDFFSPTMRIDMFIASTHPSVLDHDLNSPFIHYPQAPTENFNDYLEFVRGLFKEWRNNGAVAMKCASAYERLIQFNETSHEAASKVFYKTSAELTEEDQLTYGNYMFHWFCDLNKELEIPFQIHTGLAQISGSNPMLFEPILNQYSEIQFVLFHAGYPWFHEIAGLAHNYDNVFVDMVWAPIISTSASVQALREYIEVARSSDLIGWGGDTWTSEEAVGSVLAWKFVVSTVLAEMVKSGYMNINKAEALAHKLMYRNNAAIYDFKV